MYKIVRYLSITFYCLIIGGITASLFIATVARGEEQRAEQQAEQRASRPIDADTSSYYTELEHAPYLRINRPLDPAFEIAEGHFIWTESDSAAADLWDKAFTAHFKLAIDQAVKENAERRQRQYKLFNPPLAVEE